MTLLLAGHETTATGARLDLRPAAAHARRRSSGCSPSSTAGETRVPRRGGQRVAARAPGRPDHRAPAPRARRASAATSSSPGRSSSPRSTWRTPTPRSIPDPFAFRPERFLDEGPDTYSWIPFGGGTRRCIGAAFAQMEMRVALRTILESVKLEAADPRPETDDAPQRHPLAARRHAGGRDSALAARAGRAARTPRARARGRRSGSRTASRSRSRRRARRAARGRASPSSQAFCAASWTSR